MRVLFLLVILVVVLYFAWVFAPIDERNKAFREITPHIIKLAALLGLLAAIAAVAYYLPVSQFLKG